MLQDVGSVDRVNCVVAGLALIGASLFGAIGPWGWIGVVPLATGLFPVLSRLPPVRSQNLHGQDQHHLALNRGDR